MHGALDPLPSRSDEPAAGRQVISSYENKVVGVLCASFGAVMFDMIGVNYLIPFVVPALKLNNFQVGWAVSGYWITFAISSYLAGLITDQRRAKKRLVLTVICLFAVMPMCAGFANSFAMFLAARLAMGFVAGGFLPPAQMIIAAESSPQRLGLNMGLLQNVGSSLAAFVAPLILVYVAQSYDWRTGFFFLSIPGCFCAVLISAFVKEPEQSRGNDNPLPLPTHGRLKQLLRYQNMYSCAALAALFNATVTIGHGFVPLYYVKELHLSAGKMSFIMSVLGLSGATLGLLLPALSDRVGRRPVTIVACALGILFPVGSLYCGDSLALLTVFAYLGWAPAGATAIYSATILSETVPPALVGTAFGFVAAVSTVGGVVAGPIAGWAADRWGLSIPLLLEASCCVAMVGFACALRETAPARILATAKAVQSV